MSERKGGFFSDIKRIINPDLEGRVSGGNGSRFHLSREADLYGVMDVAREVKQASDDRRNWWGDRNISFEEESLNTSGIQESLDKEVELENRGVFTRLRGRLPCQRAKEDG